MSRCVKISVMGLRNNQRILRTISASFMSFCFGFMSYVFVSAPVLSLVCYLFVFTCFIFWSLITVFCLFIHLDVSLSRRESLVFMFKFLFFILTHTLVSCLHKCESCTAVSVNSVRQNALKK